jgi:hypothetical protein
MPHANDRWENQSCPGQWHEALYRLRSSSIERNRGWWIGTRPNRSLKLTYSTDSAFGFEQCPYHP